MKKKKLILEKLNKLESEIQNLKKEIFAPKKEDDYFAKLFDKGVSFVQYIDEKTFKEGDWLYFKYLNEEGLIRYTKSEIIDEDLYIHGSEFYWFDENVSSINDDFLYSNPKWIDNTRKATKEEIEKILMRVAKIKGFEKDVFVDCLIHKKIIKCVDTSWARYDTELDRLRFAFNDGDYVFIYNKGEWANIIKNVDDNCCLAFDYVNKMVNFEFVFQKEKSAYTYRYSVDNLKTIIEKLEND